jgi:hypothetical protein
VCVCVYPCLDAVDDAAAGRWRTPALIHFSARNFV